MATWVKVHAKDHDLLVSDEGQIHLPRKETTFSYVRLGRLETKTAVFKERMLKPSVNKMGYWEVCFQHNRKTYKFAVHRLIAMAFVQGYEEHLVVNHIDGNKQNNHASNLEWVTKSQNSKHAWEHNLIPLRGEAHPGSKLTGQQVMEIRKLLGQGVKRQSIATIAGVSCSIIHKIGEGTRWAHIPS